MNQKQARQIVKPLARKLVQETENAHGVSYGPKNGQWVLRIRVTKKKKSHEKLKRLAIGKEIRTLKAGEKAHDDELSVDVVERDVFRMLQLGHTDKWRPAIGGISVGHYDTSAGTIGVVCYKESDGKKYILSNSHILASQGQADIGDDIYQPGPYDGGGPADKIGELDSFIPYLFGGEETPNYVDCALCKPTNESDVLEEILGLVQPQEIREVVIGEEVTKSGRTTGVTEGFVSEIGETWVATSPEWTWWEDQIISPSNMSAGGDSGSLLIAKSDGAAVGLLFAGLNNETMFNEMTRVADALGITFDNTREASISVEADVSVIESKYTLKTGAMAVSAEGDVSSDSEWMGAAEIGLCSVSADGSVLAIGSAISPKNVTCEISAEVSVFADEKGYSHYGPNEGLGGYRLAEDALERYELYRGIDADPDFEAAPFETFTTLPHETGDIT